MRCCLYLFSVYNVFYERVTSLFSRACVSLGIRPPSTPRLCSAPSVGLSGRNRAARLSGNLRFRPTHISVISQSVIISHQGKHKCSPASFATLYIDLLLHKLPTARLPPLTTLFYCINKCHIVSFWLLMASLFCI